MKTSVVQLKKRICFNHILSIDISSVFNKNLDDIYQVFLFVKKLLSYYTSMCAIVCIKTISVFFQNLGNLLYTKVCDTFNLTKEYIHLCKNKVLMAPRS